MNTTIQTYFFALAFTIVIEAPIVLFIFRRQILKRTIVALLLSNGVSHSALHFLLPLLISPHLTGRFILIGELSVVVFETLMYLAVVRPKPWPLAIAASAAANGFSYAIGIIFFPAP